MSSLVCEYASDYKKVWDDRGTGGVPFDGSFFKAITPEGYYVVGDLVCGHAESSKGRVDVPNQKIIVVKEVIDEGALIEYPLLKPPVDYEMVWNDEGSRGRFGNLVIWLPIPPPDYVAMGCVVSPVYEKPVTEAIRCVHKSQVVEGIYIGRETYRNVRSKLKRGPITAWTIHGGPDGVKTGCFLFSGTTNQPSSPSPYCLRKTSLKSEGPPIALVAKWDKKTLTYNATLG
eukprot:TRINITY_DN11373_c0_g1_i1.p1 TRINITY_DN11373_c0_g1~~TRINITY_DN11373_c0_g1_i1.p1  ORF type:complete len:230 (-),score=16.37 TRINITY_DN11373_c0_g1_i1:101-790(-)